MLSFWVLQYTEHLMGRSRKPQATIHNKNQSAFMYASEESIREYIALLPPPSLHLPVHLAQTSTTPNLHLLRRTEPENIYQCKQIPNITANDFTQEASDQQEGTQVASPRAHQGIQAVGIQEAYCDPFSIPVLEKR